VNFLKKAPSQTFRSLRRSPFVKREFMKSKETPSNKWAESISFPHKKGGSTQSPQRLTLLCAKSAIGTESQQNSQPRIPAHDCPVLHVFAGTWQSRANL
jgi:hypothetical protein